MSQLLGGVGTAQTRNWLVEDMFGGSTGVSLVDRVPAISIGSPWQASNGGFSIEGSSVGSSVTRAVLTTAAAGQEVVVIDVGTTSFEIQARVKPSTDVASADFGVVGRWNHNSSYWLFNGVTGQGFSIYDRTGGTFTQRAVTNQVCTAGQSYNLNVTFSSNTISYNIVSSDASTTITFATTGNGTSVHRNNTRAGIRLHSPNDSTLNTEFEYFRVRAITST